MMITVLFSASVPHCCRRPSAHLAKIFPLHSILPTHLLVGEKRLKWPTPRKYRGLEQTAQEACLLQLEVRQVWPLTQLFPFTLCKKTLISILPASQSSWPRTPKGLVDGPFHGCQPCRVHCILNYK